MIISTATSSSDSKSDNIRTVWMIDVFRVYINFDSNFMDFEWKKNRTRWIGIKINMWNPVSLPFDRQQLNMIVNLVNSEQFHNNPSEFHADAAMGCECSDNVFVYLSGKEQHLLGVLFFDDSSTNNCVIVTKYRFFLIMYHIPCSIVCIAKSHNCHA